MTKKPDDKAKSLPQGGTCEVKIVRQPLPAASRVGPPAKKRKGPGSKARKRPRTRT